MAVEEKIRFKPFQFLHKDDDGQVNRFTFTCPVCGGHNCEKIEPTDKGCFWSGFYRCTDCGCEHDSQGRKINYYSEAFKREVINKPKQLELWEK